MPNDEVTFSDTLNQVKAFAIHTGLHDIDITPADFWGQAEQQGECWVWVGEKFANGYGKLRRYSRSDPGKRLTVSAHRYAYYLAYGYDPDQLFTCHHCDNRSCLRPDHLFLGTNLSNMHDISRKRRLVSGDLVMPPDIRAIARMLFEREAHRSFPFADKPDTHI